MTRFERTAYTEGMIRFIPFIPSHMSLFEAQRMQAAEQAMLLDTPEALDELAKGPAYTVMVDREVIGCGGLFEHWPGRVTAWAIVGTGARRHLRPVTRFVRKVIDDCPSRRVEATVRLDFFIGQRWLHMLGFVREGAMRAYSPLGEDVRMFARIKDDRP